ncbi:sensor domain-containing diguanylate cyclase [Paenibacillus sp.]|uniref:sensor domain-containing diguanylate cyclase n=1 Tax=Paenibacillus sp. TaxID=58172 RepID=UPI002D55A339|nr:diguanylate cyclase [Paenibacillus sp.]HZG57005.1 diguanylate cyclase [Paenibacillus sp.]
MDISRLSKLYIDTTEDLLFLVTVEGASPPYTFRFQSANPAYFRNTGLPPDIIGRTVAETLPRDVVDFVQTRFTEAVNVRRSIKYEEPVTFLGNRMVVETTLTPFYGEDGRAESLLGVTRDITERKASERFIRESEERYRTLVQLSPDAILIHDDGKIVFCNDACARLVAADHPEELFGASLYDYISPDERRNIASRLQRMYLSGVAEAAPLETKIIRRTGESIDVEGTSAFVEHDGKKLLQVVLRDVTKRSLEKERLQRLSQLDGLTNIANRRYFDAVLYREVNRARRNKLPLALLLCDIDNFKKYNDLYGHLTGDECLKRVTRAAGELLKRPGDLLARFGGEEFAVLLPETDEYGAIIVAEQLRSAIAALRIPHGDSDVGGIVTVSVGVSSMTRPSTSDIVPLIERADRALYAAKRAGKNRVDVYRPQPFER